MEKKDPIEDTPEFKAVIKEVEMLAKVALERDGITKEMYRGWYTHFWDCKKKILKEKYGIKWKTPYEMNPDIIYD